MNLLGKLQPVIILAAALLGLLLGTWAPPGSIRSGLIEVFLMLLLYILFLSVDLKKIRTSFANLRFTLTADGFLYHMARILVGTLLEVGLGRRPAESLPALFDARCRALAGETAPAKGPWLMEVRY